MSRRYLLDANAFIEASNRYYGFDICPGFWLSLVVRHESKRVFSIDRIAGELRKQDDEVKEWMDTKAPETFFKKTEDQAVVNKFQAVVNWVYAQSRFTDAAKSEFASVADGWLVAYASVNGLIVVTHEQFDPNIKRKVKIPNVCVEFDIEYVNTFEMLRDLGEMFIRRTKHKGTSRRSRR